MRQWVWNMTAAQQGGRGSDVCGRWAREVRRRAGGVGWREWRWLLAHDTWSRLRVLGCVLSTAQTMLSSGLRALSCLGRRFIMKCPQHHF